MNTHSTAPERIHWSAVRGRFIAMTPQIRRLAQGAFAEVAPNKREELVMRTDGHAQKVYLQLALRGVADLAYPQPLAAVALAQVRAELRLSTPQHVQCS
jgi:hypothetical protein